MTEYYRHKKKGRKDQGRSNEEGEGHRRREEREKDKRLEEDEDNKEEEYRAYTEDKRDREQGKARRGMMKKQQNEELIESTEWLNDDYQKSWIFNRKNHRRSLRSIRDEKEIDSNAEMIKKLHIKYKPNLPTSSLNDFLSEYVSGDGPIPIEKIEIAFQAVTSWCEIYSHLIPNLETLNHLLSSIQRSTELLLYTETISLSHLLHQLYNFAIKKQIQLTQEFCDTLENVCLSLNHQGKRGELIKLNALLSIMIFEKQTIQYNVIADCLSYIYSAYTTKSMNKFVTSFFETPGNLSQMKIDIVYQAVKTWSNHHKLLRPNEDTFQRLLPAICALKKPTQSQERALLFQLVISLYTFAKEYSIPLPHSFGNRLSIALKMDQAMVAQKLTEAKQTIVSTLSKHEELKHDDIIESLASTFYPFSTASLNQFIRKFPDYHSVHEVDLTFRAVTAWMDMYNVTPDMTSVKLLLQLIEKTTPISEQDEARLLQCAHVIYRCIVQHDITVPVDFVEKLSVISAPLNQAQTAASLQRLQQSIANTTYVANEMEHEEIVASLESLYHPFTSKSLNHFIQDLTKSNNSFYTTYIAVTAVSEWSNRIHMRPNVDTAELLLNAISQTISSSLEEERAQLELSRKLFAFVLQHNLPVSVRFAERLGDICMGLDKASRLEQLEELNQRVLNQLSKGEMLDYDSISHSLESIYCPLSTKQLNHFVEDYTSRYNIDAINTAFQVVNIWCERLLYLKPNLHTLELFLQVAESALAHIDQQKGRMLVQLLRSLHQWGTRYRVHTPDLFVEKLVSLCNSVDNIEKVESVDDVDDVQHPMQQDAALNLSEVDEMMRLQQAYSAYTAERINDFLNKFLADGEFNKILLGLKTIETWLNNNAALRVNLQTLELFIDRLDELQRLNEDRYDAIAEASQAIYNFGLRFEIPMSDEMAERLMESFV